jgi:hypothetical protein
VIWLASAEELELATVLAATLALSEGAADEPAADEVAAGKLDVPAAAGAGMETWPKTCAETEVANARPSAKDFIVV